MKTELWLPRRQTPPTARLRLVCFAHSGAGAAPFVPWARELPPEIALCPIRSPGRETAFREPLLGSVAEIADGAYGALSTLPPLPTVLMGHSLGAAVGFEIARRMQADGQPPRLLIVSSRHPAHLPPGITLIGHLPDEAFLDALDERYAGIPEQIKAVPELLQMMVPALKTDVRASEVYRTAAEPRLSCPMWICGGDSDLAVAPDRLARWQELTAGPATVDVYAGGHFYLFEQPDFRAKLKRLLAEQLAGLPR